MYMTNVPTVAKRSVQQATANIRNESMSATE